MSNRKVGRPLRYNNEKELTKKINEYFEKTQEEEITITGLCIYLGINKDTFYEYAKRDEYKEIINMARLIVENSYEISLRKNGRTGDIFALKNFGWTDKQEVENTTHNKVTIVNSLPKDDEDESNN